MTLLLSESDVRATLDMGTALEAVEESFRRQAAGDVCVHPRRRLELPDRVLLNHMEAADRQGGWMGAKLYSVARGRAGFVVLLYRGGTGELAALIEADWLGRLRTGAASGIATKYLARPEARSVGIIGTGGQARTQLEAICGVRKIEGIRAFGRDPARRATFCQEMTQALGVPVTPTASPEEAVRDADIVVTATNSALPVVSGEWLAAGAHVNAMGSNWAHKREIDEKAVARAAVIAADSIEQSKMESGDLILAFAGDASRWNSVIEMADIVAGKRPGRTDKSEITLFKSNGIAAWDIAVATGILERAEEQGLGKRIEFGELRR